jgi:hypothetical protein
VAANVTFQLSLDTKSDTKNSIKPAGHAIFAEREMFLFSEDFGDIILNPSSIFTSGVKEAGNIWRQRCIGIIIVAPSLPKI